MAADDSPPSEYPSAPPSHWPARLPPPPATPPPAPRGGAAAIIAGAVVFALVVTYGLGQALVRADDPGGRVAPPALPSTTTTAPVEGLVPLTQAVPSLIAFVERERGSSFVRLPQVVPQVEADFEATAASVADRDLALARHEVTYRALGLIDDDEDLLASLRALAAAASVAVHDPSTAAVYVRGDMTTPYTRTRIVAALTRLLDSQLPTAPSPSASAFDASFAVEALAAGSAATVAGAYVSQLNQADQASFAQDVRQAEAQRALSGADQRAQFFETLPSLAGRPLAFDLLRRTGGPRALDQAFAAPPASSEQAFDPESYAQADPPLSLTRLREPSGRLLDSGRFGYADVLMTLFPGLGGEEPPGQGEARWGGGRFQTWRSETGELCVQARVAGDTDGWTEELLVRFAAWASRVGGATVTEVDDPALGRPVIELRRCA